MAAAKVIGALRVKMIGRKTNIVEFVLSHEAAFSSDISIAIKSLTTNGLQIFRKRYDVHNNLAYIMTKLKRFYGRNEISK